MSKKKPKPRAAAQPEPQAEISQSESDFPIPPVPPLSLSDRISSRTVSIVVLAGLFLTIGGLVFADWYLCLPKGLSATYVGRQTCIECHDQQGLDFQGSHHDLAMDMATPSTVKAKFDGRTLKHDGIESKFYTRDEKYYVSTEGPDGKMGEFEVKYVFGTEPLQQYMVELERGDDLLDAEIGQVQVLRLSWDTNKNEWFYLRPPDVGEKLDSDDPLHWTRMTQCWNTSCADCHSTNLKKNFDEKTGNFHTTFSEIDVSCEACHGPGSLHVELANTNSLFWDRRYEYGLAKLKGSDHHQEVETCARCHSRRRLIEPGAQPGEKFGNGFVCELMTPDTYHADGQILDEVYVYGSFIQSKMYHKGIRCTDCHDPHKAQIKFPGNALCTNCHQNQHPAGVYDTPKHHFHKMGSDGASCVECHMPTTTYMNVDVRRDHSLRVPRPDLSVEIGTPNACTHCHISDTILPASDREGLELYQDWLLAAREGNETIQTELKRLDQWAAVAVEKWYGPKPRPESFAKILQRAWDNDDTVVGELADLVRETEQPAMIRASAAAQLARFDGDETLETALESIQDSEPMLVRAALSRIEIELRQLVPVIQGPGVFDRVNTIVESVVPLLNHPMLMVRVEAAQVLAGLGAQRSRLLRGDAADAFDDAVEELEASIWAQNDRAGSYVGLGLLYENLGDFDRAVNTYRVGVKVDPTIVGPRSNLANLLEVRADEMVQQVQQAIQQLQYNPSGTQSMRAELEKMAEAEAKLRSEIARLRAEELPLLEKDARRVPDVGFIQYRYGMLLYLNGRNDEAEAALKRALSLEPTNVDFIFAIALLEKEKQQWPEVLKYTQQLLDREPENPQYLMIHQEAQSNLGIVSEPGSGQ